MAEGAPGNRAVASTGLGRVLMVTSTFPRWPNDRVAPFCLQLAQDLQELGWQVDILAPHAAGAERREIFGGLAVERFRYAVPETFQTLCYDGGALVRLRRQPAKALLLPSFLASECLSVARCLRRAPYDIVHSHWILPQGFAAALATAGCRLPHVVTAHGSDVFGLQGRLLQRFKRWTLRRAAAVTANSSFTERAIVDLAGEGLPLRRIPMGVTEAPSPAAEQVAALRQSYRRGGGPLLVFVGRLVEEKGPEDMIEAVALLAPRLPGLSALVVGDGPMAGELRSLAASRGVADRIAFLGWCEPSELPAYLTAADIFIGPSKPVAKGGVEAQGLTFLEALLAATPVIATRVGGIVDAVRHEQTGLLVEPASPADIAAAIERLTNDPDLAARLALAGRDLVRANFTRQRSAAQFSQLFQELIAGRRRARADSPSVGSPRAAPHKV